jgi:polyisoprenoid-binding protein YceI
MLKRLALAALVCLFAGVARADDYVIDTAHAGVTFKISHVGLSYIYGRFNDFSGTFTLDPEASKCSFSMTIKTESIDTGIKQRDDHLRNADFFDAKQFPTISFKSSSVKEVKQGYEVTGDATMHGVTKSVTFIMTGGKKAEFPPGTQRTGFSTDFVLKRTDFGVGAKVPTNMAGDEVYVSISFEGTKKK